MFNIYLKEKELKIINESSRERSRICLYPDQSEF